MQQRKELEELHAALGAGAEAPPADEPPPVEGTAAHPAHGCPLAYTRGLRGNMCDVCGRPGLQRSHRCPRCDFDLCEACMAQHESLPELTAIVGWPARRRPARPPAPRRVNPYGEARGPRGLRASREY